MAFAILAPQAALEVAFWECVQVLPEPCEAEEIGRSITETRELFKLR